MSTSIILKVLSEAFEAAVEPIETPTGLEWVDDKSVVILWGSECEYLTFVTLSNRLIMISFLFTTTSWFTSSFFTFDWTAIGRRIPFGTSADCIKSSNCKFTISPRK